MKKLFKKNLQKAENNKEVKEMGFVKTLIIALVCAGFVRSFFFEPFHIPSSSMKPNLLIGDYIFVSKYSYGYSRYSFPLGINFFSGRVLKSTPKRGDVVVFRLPSQPSVNYVKRLIGFPGDKIQVINGVVFINEQEVAKTPNGVFVDSDSEVENEIKMFSEKLPEGKIIQTLDQNSQMAQDNTGVYEVPQGHYFMMGDNRDNSQDSRFLTEVGYVPEENLVGRADFIFFSNSKPTWQFWNWSNSIRFKRLLNKI
jgi:signal peptidase I